MRIHGPVEEPGLRGVGGGRGAGGLGGGIEYTEGHGVGKRSKDYKFLFVTLSSILQ